MQDIRRATRKHYSAEERIGIVLDGLRGEDSIAALCRREGIEQTSARAPLALLRREGKQLASTLGQLRKRRGVGWRGGGLSSLGLECRAIHSAVRLAAFRHAVSYGHGSEHGVNVCFRVVSGQAGFGRESAKSGHGRALPGSSAFRVFNL